MLPMKVVCGASNILRKSIKFPDGRELVLQPGKPYVTAVKKDIDFLSTQRDIAMYPLNLEDCRTWLMHTDIIPVIDVELSKEEAKKYVWHDEDEEYVLSELKNRGYICEKAGEDPEFISTERIRNNLSKCTNESLISELAERISKDSSLKITASELIDVKISSNIDEMTVDEITEYLRVTRNLVGLREQKSKKT